jgi:hypothetical protein
VDAAHRQVLDAVVGFRASFASGAADRGPSASAGMLACFEELERLLIASVPSICPTTWCSRRSGAPALGAYPPIRRKR